MSNLKDIKKTNITPPPTDEIHAGFLGSGKTTLLQHILSNKQGLKCAVIVNDMAELNIDSKLIQDAHLIQQEEQMIELTNGCICCTLRLDLLEEVTRLADSGKFDYLIIESTGISEPQQVAETFDIPPAEGALPLSAVAKLDTCVTVIDAANLLTNLHSLETLKDREEGAAGPDDDRNISDLLIDQIEFANVLILNKLDLVSKEDVVKMKGFLKTLNPDAIIVGSCHSAISLDLIISTGMFDIDKARRSAGWLKSLVEEHNPETLEYGIGSFVYRARKPFHPLRLRAMLDELFAIQEVLVVDAPPADDACGVGNDTAATDDTDDLVVTDDDDDDNEERDAIMLPASLSVTPQEATAMRETLQTKYGAVLRSKGWFWLATRNDMAGEWSQAGSILRITPGSPWYAAIPEDVWGDDINIEQVKKDFVPDVGDRRQEIVFIGIGINKQRLTADLDGCLMTDGECVAGLKEDGFCEWPCYEIVEVSVEEDEDDEDDDEEEEESPSKKCKK